MTLEADGRHVRSEDLRKEITVLFDKCCGPQDTESPMQRLQIPGVFETHVADLGTVSHDCRYYMPQTDRHKHRRRQTTPLHYILHGMQSNPPCCTQFWLSFEAGPWAPDKQSTARLGPNSGTARQQLLCKRVWFTKIVAHALPTNESQCVLDIWWIYILYNNYIIYIYVYIMI